MSVQCNRCGEEWPRDPALEVTCPNCKAKIGQRCMRPSGHSGPMVRFHAERDYLALELGIMKKCPGKHPDIVEATPHLASTAKRRRQPKLQIQQKGLW